MKNRRISSFVEARCGWFRLIGAAVIICGLSAHAVQYVAPDGTGEGSSWADAWTNVQDAVDAAALLGEEVWVAAGRYEVTNPVTLHTNSVVLGGFAGTESVASERDWDVNVTILDGMKTTRVVNMIEISGARFDGLVVTRGNYEAPAKGMGGGGILIEGSEACTVVNCKILHNTSERADGNSSSSEGGGIFINYSTNCVIGNCLFTDNKAINYGADLSMIYARGATRVTGCRFTGCSYSYAAGIVRLAYCTGLRISNCLASGTSADYGSFMYASQGFIADNCTICFTTSQNNGPLRLQSKCTIRNNIIAFNGGVGIWENVVTATPTINNNLFHAQTVADYNNDSQNNYLTGADAINNDVILKPERVSGNVDGDPRFMRCPTNDNGTWTSVGVYDEERAQTTLIDANAALRPGSLKGRCLNPNTAETLYRHAEIADNTATSITVWGKADWAASGDGYRVYDFRLRQDSPAFNAGLDTDAPATDLDGNPRPSMGGFDIGAYETQPQPGTKVLIQ